VTLLLIVTFITAPIQMTTARFSAIQAAEQDMKALASTRAFMWRIAAALGISLSLLFMLFAGALRAVFHTQSTLPFVIFGLALPFSLLQGVERGILQGQTRFGILAASYQVEMWTRLLVSIGLVLLGLSVNGAVIGIGLSFIATWLTARLAVKGLARAEKLSQEKRSELTAFARPVVISQLGQILINNSDIILVKALYPAEVAGRYAALALIGRIVFFATWSVVTTMFPIVAQRQKKGEPHEYLLWLSLGIVIAVSAPIVLTTLLAPAWIVNVLFGAQYLNITPLLWLYALATSLYAMANVVINYRLSLGVGRQTGFAIAAGLAQVVGILLFHQTLGQVVWVQVMIMAILFISLLAWNFGHRTVKLEDVKIVEDHA
jgi:O-antigen/teichoic acid export membrane protein